jgi:hypothetical protein
MVGERILRIKNCLAPVAPVSGRRRSSTDRAVCLSEARCDRQVRGVAGDAVVIAEMPLPSCSPLMAPLNGQEQPTSTDRRGLGPSSPALQIFGTKK